MSHLHCSYVSFLCQHPKGLGVQLTYLMNLALGTNLSGAGGGGAALFDNVQSQQTCKPSCCHLGDHSYL